MGEMYDFNMLLIYPVTTLQNYFSVLLAYVAEFLSKLYISGGSFHMNHNRPQPDSLRF